MNGKWYDMVHKSFDSYEQAVAALADGVVMEMCKDMALGIVQRKLDEGHIIVSPLVLDYVKITPKHAWPLDGVKCVMELVYICELEEIA